MPTSNFTAKLLELEEIIISDFTGVSQSGPVDKLTFSVFISAYFLKCSKKL